MKQFQFRKKNIVSEVDSQKAVNFEILTHHFLRSTGVELTVWPLPVIMAMAADFE